MKLQHWDYMSDGFIARAIVMHQVSTRPVEKTRGLRAHGGLTSCVELVDRFFV